MKSVIVGVALACVAEVVAAQVGPSTDVAVRARAAKLVAVGRIIDVQAQFQAGRFGDQLIVSSVLLEVTETLKGARAPLLRLSVEGGTVGDLTLKVSDMPVLQPGDRGVFFLDDDGRGNYLPHDRGRGILKLAQTDRVEGMPLTLDDIRQQLRAALDQEGR